MNIVLTRERGFNGSLRPFTPPSAIVHEVPLTKTLYRARTQVQQDLEDSGHYQSFWSLVVTSPRSADYLETAIHACQRDVSVFSVGRATTRAIASHDIAVAGEAETTAGELAALIRRGPVLQLGARAMRDELPRALEERGVIVVRVACYETVPADLANAQQELLASADVVFIGAPSTWGVAQSFVARDAWVVVPGPTTGNVVRQTHDRVIEGWEPALVDVLQSLDL